MVEILSVHIPKTAGGTFEKCLRRVYGSGLVLHYGSPQPEISAETRVIHGHFLAGAFSRKYPEAKLVTWLRNPVERFVSHYFYYKGAYELEEEGGNVRREELARLLWEEKLSMLQFAEHHSVKNIMTKFLNNIPLTDFFFAGVFENFQEDFAWLRKSLGWPVMPLDQVRRRELFFKPHFRHYDEYANFKLEPAARARIEELNKADMELYLAAVKQRTARLAASSEVEG